MILKQLENINKKYLIFGFKEEQDEDREFIRTWLYNRIYEYNLDANLLRKQLYIKYRTEKILAPPEWQINQLVQQLIFQREQDFYQDTYNKLSDSTLKKLMIYWITGDVFVN